jgi:hypothetical protein
MCPWAIGGFFPIQGTGIVGLDRVGSVDLCVSDAVADTTCFAATLCRVHMWPGPQSKRRSSIPYRGSYLRLYSPSISRFLDDRPEIGSQE